MRCTSEGFDGSPGTGLVCLFLVSTLLRWTGAQLHTVRTEDDDDDDDDEEKSKLESINSFMYYPFICVKCITIC